MYFNSMYIYEKKTYGHRSIIWELYNLRKMHALEFFVQEKYIFILFHLTKQQTNW